MKNSAAVFFLFALSLTAVGFGADSPRGKNRFRDPGWENGLAVVAIQTANGEAVELGTLRFFPSKGGKRGARPPYWTLGTHYSKYDISAVKPKKLGGGFYEHKTPGEAVSIRRENGETILKLDATTGAQYDSPRKRNEPWPHLLVQRDFSPDEFLRLNAGAVLFSFDVRVAGWKNLMSDEEYDPGLHCAQSNIYFVIRNINPDSPDYNDYIWFGIPVFDSRHEIVPAYQALDGDPNVLGTGKLIDTLGGAQAYEKIYAGQNPRSGDWCHGQLDLAAEALEALDAAKKFGFMPQTTLDDLAVVHINFGWEMPGIFDASLEIKNLKLVSEQ